MRRRAKKLPVRDDLDDAAQMLRIVETTEDDGAMGRGRKSEKRLDHHD